MVRIPPDHQAVQKILGTCRFELDLKAWDALNRALDRPAQTKPRLQRLFAESTILEKSDRWG
jgi:uncharacterized protein (DUF1778 family)